MSENFIVFLCVALQIFSRYLYYLSVLILRYLYIVLQLEPEGQTSEIQAALAVNVAEGGGSRGSAIWFYSADLEIMKI